MTTAVDFKPSQVDLGGSFPPLCATMGRTEREAAATLIVRACQVGGDEWKPVGPGDIRSVGMADDEAKTEPLHSLLRNPFWRPDFWDLVDRGFARWTGPEAGKGPLELTDVGLEKLRRYVRTEPAAHPPEVQGRGP